MVVYGNSVLLQDLCKSETVLKIFCSFKCLYITWWEKAMAPNSSTLAWKILWTEEPGRLQSMGSLRVGHN